MRPFTPPPITRLRITPDPPKQGDAPAVTNERPQTNGKASRRPHTDMRVAAVKSLIERTTLTYSEISAKTGVGRASISRWSRDGKWLRPLDAPRATDRMPTERAGRKLKQRKLAERLHTLAERAIRELEEAPRVEIEALMQALQVLRMARVEAQGRRRRPKWHGPTETGAQWLSRQEAIKTALKEMRRGGVDIDRAPPEALELVIDAIPSPEDDHPALRQRGKRRSHP
jgi:transcriptional regulator with XRE-family HTH domain